MWGSRVQWEITSLIYKDYVRSMMPGWSQINTQNLYLQSSLVTTLKTQLWTFPLPSPIVMSTLPTKYNPPPRWIKKVTTFRVLLLAALVTVFDAQIVQELFNFCFILEINKARHHHCGEGISLRPTPTCSSTLGSKDKLLEAPPFWPFTWSDSRSQPPRLNFLHPPSPFIESVTASIRSCLTSVCWAKCGQTAKSGGGEALIDVGRQQRTRQEEGKRPMIEHRNAGLWLMGMKSRAGGFNWCRDCHPGNYFRVVGL